jgi:hypothetical protein
MDEFKKIAWVQPGMKSDAEMERDAVNRYSKYNTAIRGREGLGEEDADVATEYGGPYEDYKNYQGKKVKIDRTLSGEHEGKVGTVVKADKYRDENGDWQAEFDVQLDSGETIKLYPGEWSYDQLSLVVDPYQDFMLSNPFESLEEGYKFEPDWDSPMSNEPDFDDPLMGKSVVIGSGEYRGERGKVIAVDTFADGHDEPAVAYKIKLHNEPKVVVVTTGEYQRGEVYPEFDESLEEAKGKGVNVPSEGFSSSEEAEKFIHDLGPDDEVDDYVVDPETGEVLFEPFMTKRGVGMDQFKSARDRNERMETWVPSIYGANNQDDAWEELGDLKSGNTGAGRFYHIVWRGLDELLGSPDDLGADVDDWGQLDYDTSYEVPVAIKRKDGKRMQEEDYDNFRELAKLIKLSTGNISLSMMGTTDKGRVVRFTPTLM